MSGLYAQIGYAQETTYGAAVTVSRFVPLVDESLTQEIDRIESDAVIAGAQIIRSEQWGPGGVTVGGDVGHEWFQQNMGLLFSHMLGTVTSSFTAGVGTHTFTPGPLTKSLTVQVGRPTPGGATVVPFTYAGCKVQSWSLAVEAGENATLGLTLIGQSMTTGTALAAASFPAGSARPFRFQQTAMTISGSAVCVRSIEINGENSLSDDRRCIGQATIDEPVVMDRREISGTISLEFTSTVQHQRFVDGTELPVVLTATAGPGAGATLTMNVRYDGAPHTVDGRDLIVTDVPFKCVAPTSDAGAFTAVLVNGQSSP